VGACIALLATIVATGSYPSGPKPAAALASSVPAARNLSLPQLVGQRVVYSYRGLTPPASLLARIRAGQAAGVVFFKGNIANERQLRAVTAELQRAALQSPVKLPLLLMTDQEGGLVRRLPGAPTLSEKQIGQSAEPATAARRAGHNAGLNLAGVGLNVNLAPVLDVYRTPGDFIDQYGRSYSDDPRLVSKLGAAFITAQQKAGVATVAKHFPGLGAASTNQNTDLRPVTLKQSLANLRAVDELPYPAAIKAQVSLVMVSWATYPALDAKRPAGLSPVVVKQELRGRLGFAGVTITDALGAGGLPKSDTIAERAVLAVRAGMDLLLCSNQRTRQGANAAGGLLAALRAHKISRVTFNESVDRVLALRAALAG